MADRQTINCLAREAVLHSGADTDEVLQRFSDLVIADFLQRTGQYLTNEASREAVIADAVAEEREACANAKPSEPVGLSPVLRAAYDLGVAETHAAIRARGQHG